MSALSAVISRPSQPHVLSSASTWGGNGRRAARSGAVCGASFNSDQPKEQDWRSFRARLVAQEKSVTSSSVDPNTQLLALQSPALAAEAAWAHATSAPEAGGLLLATSQTAGLVGVDYWQAVILLLQHSSRGSMGLVLNRPTNARVARGRSGLPTPVHGAQDGVPNSRLYWGGEHAEHAVTLLHGGDQDVPKGSREVAPGVHVLFGQAQVAEVASTCLGQAGTPLRFFAGACAWGPGGLEHQLEQGAWTTAAASRNLALKHCLQLPVPLWQEVMDLVGGKCALPGHAPQVRQLEE